MACVARRREAGLDMVRIRRAIEVFLVAGRARSVRQLVVAIHVTLRTGDRGMHAGKRPPGLRVIELSTAPRVCIVAVLASRRNSRLFVIGIGGPVVVVQVTRHTRSVCQMIVAVCMASRALDDLVLSGQSPTRLGVVKECVRPRCGVVARIAGGRESCLLVVRVGRPVVFLHVATVAAASRQVVVSVYVTLLARQVSVCSRQREACEGVIEGRISP